MAQSNLVSLIMQFLTPDLIGRIASALGLERNLLQTAIGAAVPGLLAGFNGVAAQPGGATKLADAARQWSGTLGTFASTIGTGAQTSLVEKGSQLISSLLGGRDQTALTRAVANFAGVKQGTSSSLLGMLAPVVIGTIAKEQGTRSLDASGIASLLSRQQDAIAAAMPAGFSNLLDGTELLASIGGATRTATAAAGQAARAATSAAGSISNSTARTIGDARGHAVGTAGSVNWVYWLIPILAVAALAAYLLYHLPSAMHEVTGQAQQTPTSARNLTVAGLDLGKQINDSVASAQTALHGITDVVSAQAALPKLRSATAQIDKSGAVAGQLSAEQRTVLAGSVTPLLASLDQLFDKVLAVPGVAEVLKPAIDNLRAKLLRLTA
jgi:Bacterial protein of unknown function (DUF937)